MRPLLIIVWLVASSPLRAEFGFGPHDTNRPPQGDTQRYQAPAVPQPQAIPSPSLFRPQVSDYDSGNAATFAWLSYLAYLKKPDGSPDMQAIARQLSRWPGATIEPIDDNPVQGFILKAGGVAVVVFRGSDQLGDWLDNAKIAYPSTGGSRQFGRPAQLNPRRTNRQARTIVHDLHVGFSSQAKRVHDQILAGLRGMENSQVWFTGHSLGGALASIFARDLHESHGFKKTGLYTFGAPRAGNQNHAEYFTENGVAAHRVEYQLDPVPGLPGALFRSVGELSYVKKTDEGCQAVEESRVGGVIRNLRAKAGLLNPLNSSAGDHSILNYVDCLMQIHQSGG